MKDIISMLLLFGIIFSLMLLALTYSNFYYQEIKQDPVFTIGTVIEAKAGRGYTFIYVYKVGNKKIRKKSSAYYICGEKLVGIRLPVVYNRKSPEQSMLLVTPYDYFKWGLVYPDSLKWIFYCSRGSFGPREFEEWKIEYLQPPYL